MLNKLPIILEETMIITNQFKFQKRHSIIKQVYQIIYNISRELEKRKKILLNNIPEHKILVYKDIC